MRLRSGRTTTPNVAREDPVEISRRVQVSVSRSDAVTGRRAVRVTLAAEMFSFLGWNGDGASTRTTMPSREKSAVSSAIDRAAEAILPNFEAARERQAARQGAARFLNMEEDRVPRRKTPFFRKKKRGQLP